MASTQIQVIIIFTDYSESRCFTISISKQSTLEDFKNNIIETAQIDYPKWKPESIQLLLLKKEFGEFNYEILPVHDNNIFFPSMLHGFEYIYYASIVDFEELKKRFSKALFELNAEISMLNSNFQIQINVESTVKDLINKIKQSYDFVGDKYLQLFHQKFKGTERMHPDRKIKYYGRRCFDLTTDQITTWIEKAQKNAYYPDRRLKIKGLLLDGKLKENEYIYRVYYDTGYRILLYGYIRKTTNVKFYHKIPRDIIESINLFFFDNEIYSIKYNCIGNCILDKTIPIYDCKEKISKLLRTLDVIMPADLMRLRKLTFDSKRMGEAYYDNMNLFNNEKKSNKKKDFIQIVAQRITKREHFTKASRLINIGRFIPRIAYRDEPTIGIFREVCLVEYNTMKMKEFLEIIAEQVYEAVETIKLNEIKICTPKPYMIKNKQYQLFQFSRYSASMDFLVQRRLNVSNGNYVLYRLPKQ